MDLHNKPGNPSEKGRRFSKAGRRVFILGGVFCVCLVALIIRMATLDLSPGHIRPTPPPDTTERTEIIQAVRGQIYDRNGEPLVTNEYTYRIVLDNAAMAGDVATRCRDILRVYGALVSEGLLGKMTDTDTAFPFSGIYPDYYLRESALAGGAGSPAYDALTTVLSETGLRTAAVQKLRKERGMTMDDARAAYDADPLSYTPPGSVLDWFVNKYGLTDVDESDGKRVYTDAEVDRLLRILWDMTRQGFSNANDYVLTGGVDMDAVTRMCEYGINGLTYSTGVTRVYTYPGYASHILGEVGPIYAEDWPTYKELGYNMNATVGISGVEKAFETYLHGQDGLAVIEEDADGRVVNRYVKKEPVAGKDVYLTIDIRLQIAAEDGLSQNVAYVRSTLGHNDCRGGACVAVNPNNGEILALASYPTFNLATFHADYETLSQDRDLPLYNRALNGLYAPGSTFKLGMSAAALTEGVINRNTLILCDGKYTYYKSYQPTCWIYTSTTQSTHKHGSINVVEAIRVSCNCFFYETGRLLGIDRMNRYMYAWGLGNSTGIELPESEGILAGPAYRETSHGVTWQPTDTIAAAIGQSENAFTPLQLAMYTSAVTTGGTRYRATLLSRVADFATGESVLVSAPVALESVPLSASVTDTVLTGMEQMVSTSSYAAPYFSQLPVRIGGKTGTAQTGVTENGLFVCIAPSRNPEIAVCAVLERAGGGSYSIPTCSAVLKAYYSVGR